ncbi:hypothetical protein [Carboxylicivirga linearis]|uniref:Lipocalin-like domain-containing protein n=1 Tax=Carboxylicivirga linearis TaxID=1628157 RepID=A0ABS5JYM4_9BACT|nr:hypothetical protein [Carboxylicivirga linearis]MBS2100019.1 hypothetical protein [Carboxylicivirga linearis]
MRFKSFYVTTLFAILFTSSCSKDSDQDLQSGSIEGNWKVYSALSSNGDWDVSYEDDNYIYEFKNDGTCEGNVAVVELIPVFGHWSIESNNLTISGDGYKLEYKLAKLDANSLILHKMWEDNTNYYEVALKRQ